ncbi:MAG: amidohydrolase family protein [Planctomycetota bacterium]
MNRRQFLMGSAVLAAGCQLNGQSRNPEGVRPIVDTHQHLWDLDILRLPWLKAGGELTRSFTQADYKEATRGLGIAKAVYMEVGVAPDQKVAEAEYIAKMCADRSNPTCAAVIGGLILEDGFKDYIMRFAGSPYIKGVRHGLNRPGQFEDDRLVQNLKLLGSLNMSFDLVIPPRLIGQAAKLIERCGDTRFILDHCGNADPLAFTADLDWDRKPQHDADAWRRDIEMLAAQPNIICKISGVIARVPKGKATAEIPSPIVNHCLDTFGPDRVIFASDWPVCTRGAPLRVWVNLLREIVKDRPSGQKRKLFWSNANDFYGLA